MRKIYTLILIFILIIFSICIFEKNNRTLNISKDGTIEYDLSTQSQTKARKILYDYVLKDLNKTPEEAKNIANITPENVNAFETDLNNDGNKEIIGVVYSTMYWGVFGYSLFILEKKDDNYNNLTNLTINFEPKEKIYIQNTETNNYKDIKLYDINANPVTVKYNNKIYN